MRIWPIVVVAVAASACAPDEEAVPLTREQLLDPGACRACHPRHYDEWAGSMHAQSGLDPVFLSINNWAQEATDGAVAGYCVNCHAPTALREGLTTDGTNLHDLPEGLTGVTCHFCHSVEEVTGTHNAPLTLATDGIMLGGVREPFETPAHTSGHSDLLDGRALASSDVCGSCHDVVTPNGLFLEQTYDEWKKSLFGQPGDPQAISCAGCHMPGEDAPIATVPGAPTRRLYSHRMAAVDTVLRPKMDFPSQRRDIREFLETTVRAAVCVQPRQSGGSIRVVLENVGAGHGFPSGAAHYRRAWVEVTAFAGDELVYQVGALDDGEPTSHLEDDAWLLGSKLYGADGAEVHAVWEAVTAETEALPAPTRASAIEPGWVETHRIRTFRYEGPSPTRVRVRVRLRAMALDLLQELVDDGRLDADVIGRVQTYELAGAEVRWSVGDEPHPTCP
jgi:hypothetical protein